MAQELLREPWVVADGSLAAPASLAGSLAQEILLRAARKVIAPTIFPGAVSLIVPGLGDRTDPTALALPAELVEWGVFAPVSSHTVRHWVWHRSAALAHIPSDLLLVDLSGGLIPMERLITTLQGQREQLEPHLDCVEMEGGQLYAVLVGWRAALGPDAEAGDALPLPEAPSPPGAPTATSGPSRPFPKPWAEHVCGRCGESGRWKRCAACLAVRYCSAVCQADHWPHRRVHCRKRARQRLAAME